jgi:hypothetical protein
MISLSLCGFAFGLCPPPPRRPAVVRDTLLGAVATQLLQAGSEVVSLFHRRLEHGYPTPSLGRDAVLEQALPWLQETAGIWSRGRFGSYKVRSCFIQLCMAGRVSFPGWNICWWLRNTLCWLRMCYWAVVVGRRCRVSRCAWVARAGLLLSS